MTYCHLDDKTLSGIPQQQIKITNNYTPQQITN